MEWNDINVLRLIELYRERKILWNCKLKEYKNKNKRHDGLLEIAVSFGVSKEEVDKIIRYLLSHFAREVKKENDTNKNGNRSDERYKSKWFAFKNLLFLRDRNKPKGSTDTEDNGTVDIENKEATEELREDQVGTNRPAILTQGAQVGTNARSLLKAHTSSGRQQIIPVVNEAINLMKSIQSRKMQDQDEFSAFGEQLAMKMRKLSSPHAVQNAINSILFEAEMGRFDNPPPPLFHHNPTAIYNTNLPLNIPPQFPLYCSPSPLIPASTNCLGGTTYVYSTSPSVQSEQSYGDERPSSSHSQHREVEVGSGADIDYEAILCSLD
ncbi:hypothetical protein RN001_000342 [Aquatica leii]|uniref:MADF domain-containing protein n=1 Tax=Aquatica leii TaxID=1421715 RepID=A0AAN7SC62_9COLE|nr:hypothetical protein RN001_000342 [Aquatica leii]